MREVSDALSATLKQFDHDLPDYLPILLSKVLLAFAIDFETEANFPLALYANFLRPAHEQDIRVKDIPRLSGVSKEATAMALDRLQKQRKAEVKNESPASRFKVLAVNAKGRAKIACCVRIIDEIQTRWQERFGAGQIANLRGSLESLIQAESSERPSL